MEQPEQLIATAGPKRPGLAGTRSVHYGPIWDQTLEAANLRGNGPVAVLVCHGMGQQVRYETISSVAQAILTEAAAEGGSSEPVEVHLTQANDDFLGRAEIEWTDKENEKHRVHVYEAYWAPITEGRVTYWDTIKFLLLAAWNGLKYSKPFVRGTFRRWMFGGRQALTISSFSWFGLVVVLLFLMLQVAIIGYVLMMLAAQYKIVLSEPLPTVARNGFVLTWLKWVSPFFPGINVLLNPGQYGREWWEALSHFVLWFTVIGEALFARYFIIQYVGDVAAYISPYKDSKFDEIRHQIQKIGFNVGKTIYGFGPSLATAPKYRKLVVVGHSLGSVLAYDTLNALIDLDNVSAHADQRQVVKRTRALITFGSPLDKTAFIFRMQANSDQDWIREQLAASAQPLILKYEDYRPDSFTWMNIWSPMDIISGSLDYYDDPAVKPGDPRHVQNRVDPEAWVPLMAHVQYWENALLRKEIYQCVL